MNSQRCKNLLKELNSDTMCFLRTDAFDVCSSGILKSDDGKRVTTKDNGHAYAFLNHGFSKGKFMWEYRLPHEPDQKLCIGVGIQPCTDARHDNSRGFWLYKPMDGNIYDRGTLQERPVSVAHVDTVLKLILDCDAGDMELIVGTASQG